MESRPALVPGLDSQTFREYYYLKEELVVFCRNNHLPASGGKQELTERIACFLDTGRVQQPVVKNNRIILKNFHQTRIITCLWWELILILNH